MRRRLLWFILLVTLTFVGTLPMTGFRAPAQSSTPGADSLVTNGTKTATEQQAANLVVEHADLWPQLAVNASTDQNDKE